MIWTVSPFFIFITLPQTLQRLWRQRYDLHESPVTQLTGHAAKYACALGVHGLAVEDHRRVVVETDIRAIGTPILFHSSHDHGFHHFTLLDRAMWRGLLYR